MRVKHSLRMIALASTVSVLAIGSAFAQGAATPTPKATASVEQVADSAKNQMLTLYANGAVVQEERLFPCRLGSNTIQLQGVSAQYRPQTLMVQSATGSGVLTLNAVSYQAPNLSGDSLLAKSIGKHVTVTVGSGGQAASVSGTLLHASEGELIVQTDQDAGGAAHIIRALSDVQVDGVPSGLSATASLTMNADCSAGGSYDMKLLYQTGGLSWHPTHSVVYDDKAGQLSVFDSSVAVSNNSGTAYDHVAVNLISGYLSDSSHFAEERSLGAPMAAAAPAFVGGPGGSVQSVGEQKMFTVPAPLSLASGETKQVPLFQSVNVPAERQYEFTAESADLQPATLKLHLMNDAAHNMGKSLPGGSVRIYQKDKSGALQLTGSTNVNDLSPNQAFDLSMGPVQDVKGEFASLNVQDQKDQAGKVVARIATYKVTMHNYKSQDVRVRVSTYPGDAPQVLRSTSPFDLKNGILSTTVMVPRDGTTEIVYTVKTAQ